MSDDWWCCVCGHDPCDGLDCGVYPHRPDLEYKRFWQCPRCKNFVGCHKRVDLNNRPLGVIATPELRKLRRRVHEFIDPLWRRKHMPRRTLYQRLGEALGRHYHTADLRSEEEVAMVLSEANRVWEEVLHAE